MSKADKKAALFLNGKFTGSLEAKTSVMDPGFCFGLGLFESMRSYRGKIVYLDEHIERIKNSCRLIGLKFPFSAPRLKQLIRKCVDANGSVDTYVKLILWKAIKGTNYLIITKRYNAPSLNRYKSGFKVLISDLRQDEKSLTARIKTTNRLLYQLSFNEARKKGFDEALILNNRGLLAEGSRSNVFFIKDNEVFTPSLECGCLGGVTRKVIFDLCSKLKIKIYTGRFTVKDLLESDEAFLTNSLMGIMPLSFLNQNAIGNASLRHITSLLQKKYRALL
ncbi:MAG: aminotransferase class IV [Candidatus Omnitrophica bacterium]|nr:aminotransferase class IV [Candidatus Omnitrophota bacterium]